MVFCNLRASCWKTRLWPDSSSGLFDRYRNQVDPWQSFRSEQPAGRFQFTFTPKRGSWLNLVESFFSKLARSVLRQIRVASKQELKDRIMAALDGFNQHPAVHTSP
jgi:hypothetical protein